MHETLSVHLPSGEKWDHDSEDEFFADYRSGFKWATFDRRYGNYSVGFRGSISLSAWTTSTEVKISMPSRADVEKVFGILDSNVEKCRLPEPSLEKIQRHQIKVFIGHGQNPQWRDLKDHLHEKHGLEVEAYELGARAGLTIRDVLDGMLATSSFALLVLTGEDLDVQGKLHARENVIHELGLFQGRLGWRKAIALLENGVEEFSNIHGLNQIRFSKGNIQETFGEVLATLKREFPEEE
jgi:predicted nucleotide-binding protein